MRPLCALAAALALTIACGGGNTPTSPTPGGPNAVTAGGFTSVILTRGTMSATVDGAPWTAMTVSGSTGTFNDGRPGAALISGMAAGATPFTPGLFIRISAPLSVGTHTFDDLTPLSFSLSEGLSLRWSADAFRPGGGTVTLTTVTPTRLTGTFSVTVGAHAADMSPQTRVVTNGTFDLSQ